MDSKTHWDTNQKVARGAELHTGRRVEEAGLLEGSYQALASNSVPKKGRSNFTLKSYIQPLTFWKPKIYFMLQYLTYHLCYMDSMQSKQ